MNNSLKLAFAVFALAISIPQGALATEVTPKPVTAADTDASGMTDAEVRKVDLEAGRVTLKHAPIKELDMPAMTMVFNARDKAMLEKVKVGDRVKFKAISEGGKFTITELRQIP